METLIIYTLIGIVLFMSARSIYRTFNGDKPPCDCENSDCSRFGDCSSIRFSENCEDEKKPEMISIPMNIKPNDN
ncbi:MAG: hypothetical protein HN356_08160 [Calditrichaeota bacterium]|nr:hypothetical protein [Calditrichota bacterium]MBT7790344.1 hypothetical protein [Calditrichota bacterium]